MTILDWMCFQDLCHTFTVLSLQNCDPIKTVQANLGRATAAFTLNVYGQVLEKMKEDSVARMQQNNENMALESPRSNRPDG